MAKATDSTLEKGTRDVELKQPDGWYGARHTQVLLYFILMVLAYGMRVNLSVGIVAMLDPTASSNPDIPTYDWDNKSIILSSFFWGYVIPQIAAGHFSKKYGARWILVVAMSMNSIFSMLIPTMASVLGSTGVIMCRVGQGFSQGFMFPSVHTLLSKWAPLSERSRIGTFVYTGGPFGTVLSLPVTGWISASWIGWPAAFYIYGSLGLLWSVVFFIMGSESPAEHKTISQEERLYIEKSLGHENGHTHEATPWRKIATSLPLWAVLVAHCGQNWGFWTLLTEIPSYMDEVMNYDIKSNGLLSAAPYFTLWLLGFVFSPITDTLISRGITSVTLARKIMNTIGLGVPAIALIALAYTDTSLEGVVLALLIIAVGFNAAIFCGYNVNHIDLSPNHSGTLMGITNGFSNICGIVGPLSVQYIVVEEGNVYQWRIVFLLAASIYLASSIFYIAFASGELQPWDSTELQRTSTEIKDKEQKEDSNNR